MTGQIGMKLKFLIGVGVVNTLLFTGAKDIDISIWWVLLAEVVLFVGYIMVKSWFHPTQQLVNQGAHMGWTNAGIVRGTDGMREMLMKRDGMVVRVAYLEKAVYLVEPRVEGPYRDFVELEQILAVYG